MFIGKVKFYDDYVNYFGRIVDGVSQKEYNFKKYITDRSPAAGDIVKYKLIESKQKGQYRAVEVSNVSCITDKEYDTIVEFIKEQSEDKIISSELLVYHAQNVKDDISFSRLCTLLKYYYIVDVKTLRERTCEVFENLNVEYKYRFLMWNSSVKRIGLNFINESLPSESLYPLIDAGYSYFVVRDGVLTIEDERILLQHAIESNKLSASTLLSIFSRCVSKLPPTDPMYCNVIKAIKSKTESEELYELIRKERILSLGVWFHKKDIKYLFDKSFFLERENNIDDLENILCIQFSYEEKERIVDAIKLPIKDKLTRIHKSFFSTQDYEQYKIHIINQLNTEELINLWLLDYIDLPISIEDLNLHICNSSDPVDKINSIISSDKLNDDMLNELVMRYCSQLDLSKENIEWCINNKGIAKLPFSIDELFSFILNLSNSTDMLDLIIESQILDYNQSNLLLSKFVRAITLQKENVEWCILHKKIIESNHSVYAVLKVVERTINWVQSNSIDKFDEQYLSCFHYLSDVQQMTFLQKYIELKRLGLTTIYIKNLENLISVKKDIDINVYIIIYSLCKLRREQKFISNYELYTALSEIAPTKSSTNNNLRELETAKLFDICHSRCALIGSGGQREEDTVFIEIQPNCNASIKFSKDFQLYANVLKDTIPAEYRKYDATSRLWTCNINAYRQVLSFAKRTSALLRIKGKLYKISNSDRWHHPEFCEGISYIDERIADTAYWCIGNSCLRCNIKTHDKYSDYTLNDFIYILNLDKICAERGVDIDKHIRYFYSNLNWFSLSVSHLYCNSCGQILNPSEKIKSSMEEGPVTAHTITRYKCENTSCNECGRVLYINHCFMPGCRTIVDSRESRTCNNGFVICKECGVCCGSQQFERRIKAGLGAPNIRFHYDNLEFYCAKCGAPLLKVDENNFKCESCGNYSVRLKKRTNGYVYPEVVKSPYVG